MPDQERFEARFEAAYDRYLEDAPVAIDPRALTRAITAASPRTTAGASSPWAPHSDSS